MFQHKYDLLRIVDLQGDTTRSTAYTGQEVRAPPHAMADPHIRTLACPTLQESPCHLVTAKLNYQSSTHRCFLRGKNSYTQSPQSWFFHTGPWGKSVHQPILMYTNHCYPSNKQPNNYICIVCPFLSRSTSKLLFAPFCSTFLDVHHDSSSVKKLMNH